MDTTPNLEPDHAAVPNPNLSEVAPPLTRLLPTLFLLVIRRQTFHHLTLVVQPLYLLLLLLLLLSTLLSQYLTTQRLQPLPLVLPIHPPGLALLIISTTHRTEWLLSTLKNAL